MGSSAFYFFIYFLHGLRIVNLFEGTQAAFCFSWPSYCADLSSLSCSSWLFLGNSFDLLYPTHFLLNCSRRRNATHTVIWTKSLSPIKNRWQKKNGSHYELLSFHLAFALVSARSPLWPGGANFWRRAQPNKMISHQQTARRAKRGRLLNDCVCVCQKNREASERACIWVSCIDYVVCSLNFSPYVLYSLIQFIIIILKPKTRLRVWLNMFRISLGKIWGNRWRSCINTMKS